MNLRECLPAATKSPPDLVVGMEHERSWMIRRIAEGMILNSVAIAATYTANARRLGLRVIELFVRELAGWTLNFPGTR
jgi:hypothetical protein